MICGVRGKDGVSANAPRQQRSADVSGKSGVFRSFMLVGKETNLKIGCVIDWGAVNGNNAVTDTHDKLAHDNALEVDGVGYLLCGRQYLTSKLNVANA